LYAKSRWFAGVLIPYAANNTEFVAQWYMNKDAPPIFLVHQIIPREVTKVANGLGKFEGQDIVAMVIRLMLLDSSPTITQTCFIKVFYGYSIRQFGIPDESNSMGSCNLCAPKPPVCTYVINEHGVITCPEKMEIVLNWPTSSAWGRVEKLS
jgi:hypothetical protein